MSGHGRQVGRGQPAADGQAVLLPQLPAGLAVERPVVRRAVDRMRPLLVADVERDGVGLLVVVVDLPAVVDELKRLELPRPVRVGGTPYS